MTCSAPRCLAAAALVAAGLWTITGLAFAATVAIGPLRVHAHGLLAGLGLHPVPHDPTTGALARRLATNLRVAALPVLLAAIGAAATASPACSPTRSSPRRSPPTRHSSAPPSPSTAAACSATCRTCRWSGRRSPAPPHRGLTARRRPLDTGDWRPAVAAALALLVAAGVVETYLTPRPG